MLKRPVWMFGLAWLVAGCAAIPQTQMNSMRAARDTVCVKTNYWNPCVPMRRELLRSDANWRMLLGEDVP